MLSEITRAGYEKRWNEKEWAQRDVRYSVIGEENTDLNGLEQTDTDGGNKKSSTSVRSESGISHLYSDYRRLTEAASNTAGVAIQSVEQNHEIAPEDEKVKRAIDGIKNVLLHIQSKKNFLQAQNIVATMEVDAGFTRESKDSVYLEISDKSTVRVSNHAATASTFKTIGEAAIFGVNKKIVSKLSLRDLQLVQRNSFNTIHNITDKNSPVKLDIKKNTQSLQFGRWFKNSVVVDENAEP